MKFEMTRKKMAILIAIIIIVPIIYHKISGAFTGALMMHMMSLPKEVVVSNPESKDVNITVDTTGRVEAQYSVDVMARVSGFLQKKYFKEGDFVILFFLLIYVNKKYLRFMNIAIILFIYILYI